MKVLICDPETRPGEFLAEGLGRLGHEATAVGNGKDAQSVLSCGDFGMVLINCALSSYSAIEVVKFIRFKNIKAKILMTAKDERELEDWAFGKQNLNKLGIGGSLTGVVTAERVDSQIKGFTSRQKWREVKESGIKRKNDQVEVKAYDDQFTLIKIEEFFCGNLAIFDIYIRLGRNKYLKILNQGEAMERERLENYEKNKGVKELYFLTKDRKVYINFLNTLIEKTLGRAGIGEKTKINFVSNMAKMMVQEIYTKGMDKETLEETLKVCDNAHQVVASMPSLKKMLCEYIEYEDSAEGHLALTMLYADAISQNIEWVGERARSKILLGALLHDIGKLKLPAALRLKKVSELSGKSLEEYKKHCVYGVELLDQVSDIGEQVKQIVLQHHELNNGEGFPFGITGGKIYPPAKIVAFANRMAELSISMGAAPYEVLKKIVSEKTEIFNYDTEVVKAFIKCFTKEGGQ